MAYRNRPTSSSSTGSSIAVRHAMLCGLGNIGSVAADLIAPLGISHLTLCDQGSYEKSNIAGQAIDRSAVGRAKVSVIAARLRKIRSDLAIHLIHAKVQDVPLGILRRADVILCAFDSRRARAYANQAARWLGTPVFIDAGVEPSQLLARVNVHRPLSSCLQCAWSDEDYDLIETPNPCNPEGAAPSTNAPAALGALAASMLAIELKKVIDGDFDNLATGKQVTYCALSHRLFTTAIRPNPACRCEHTAWNVERDQRSPASFTLEQALRLGESISVPGKAFIGALACQSCGARRKDSRLEGRLTVRQLVCSRCGKEMVAPGFDYMDRLDRACVANRSLLNRPLAALGFVRGDILCLHSRKRVRLLQIGLGDTAKEVRRG